jgi:prepilin-type N-terminal cleavage/methylation domain-containing protein/prepilin-type processing-associated H-X9-DG protein
VLRKLLIRSKDVSLRERNDFRALSRSRQCRSGFTIIELLVVIAITSILIALLLPAVQYAREASRQTQCRNNLKQIATAALNFEATYSHLPANGWGFGWMGDPNRGVGRQQPGGWIYQLLPFLEQSALAERGKGLTSNALSTELNRVARTSLSMFRCATRSAPATSPQTKDFQYRNMIQPDVVAKTDYAVNEGDYITNTPAGPDSLAQGDDPEFSWQDVTKATGISFLRTGVRVADISDGLSTTYFAGEKYVDTRGYDSAVDDGHDQTMFSGVDLDNARWTIEPPLQDRNAAIPRRFGRPHSGGCFMAMCDGSVALTSYSIDAGVFRAGGTRSGSADF